MLVNKISSILSQIPLNVWEEIVKREPEWEFMFDLFKLWGFGKFSVLMMAAGLNDYQSKRKTEKSYWPGIRKFLDNKPIPNTIEELSSFLPEFYPQARERYYNKKSNRVKKFLSSDLARWLWSSTPDEVAENFSNIWEKLAKVMGQKPNEKTILLAMKCLGIALRMSGIQNIKSLEKMPVPVDSRVRKFTKKIGISSERNEDVQRFWSEILNEIRKNVEINMIHLDSLLWQIGDLKKAEIIEYFKKLGLREIGEKFSEVISK